MIYVVEKGDTLSGIAVKFGVPVWKIVYDNQLKDKNQIVPGQALLLLEVDEGQAEESTQPELAKGKTVGGYAYPFIDKEILDRDRMASRSKTDHGSYAVFGRSF